MSAELKKIIEAVLLVSDSPLSVARIQDLFADDSQPSSDDVKEAIQQLQQECEARGVELRKIGNAYRYQSRPKYAEWIGKLHATRPPRLSRALLETLAIIAYRQPVTRGDIETIRGVGVTTEIVRRLLEREWIKEAGVRDLPGHPALFATTAEFLSYFGLESLKDLPPLPEQRELGEIAGDIAGETNTPFPPEVLASLGNPVDLPSDAETTAEATQETTAEDAVPQSSAESDAQTEPHSPASEELMSEELMPEEPGQAQPES